jgi:FkbM family methyltransferase
MLPVYRSRHHQYDTFLPILVRQLGAAGIVVDVGANVGDTLAGMSHENRSLRYVCIEPDDEFFRYLRNNLSRLEKQHGSLSVELIKALVGDGDKVASLRGQGGTKSAVADGGGVRSRPLDVLVPKSDHPLVRLIKSDVDGFDYEVIRSATAIRRCCAPILYFECQFVSEEQRRGFDCLISDLIEDGYRNWVVFDNFGGLMLETSDFMTLRALLAYVWAQNVGNSSRTIYYYDLLAYTPKDKECVSAALSDYRSCKH